MQNSREEEDFREEKPVKSEWDEWREDDTARRNRERELDDRRPY